MKRPDIGPDIERMTTYCTYCPKMCRFSCPAASAEGRETVTPWGMMRLFEFARDGSLPLDDETAEAFFHCTGCRRCQTFCAHDNDVPKALWAARRWVVDSGFLPEPYIALHESFEERGTPYSENPNSIDDSVFHAEGSVGYWPDCSTVADRPELVGAIGRLLTQVTGDKIRLIRSAEMGQPVCCGFPLTGAGLETAQSCREDRWPSLEGLEMVWTDCPALASWNRDDSSWSLDDDGSPPIDHVFSLFSDGLNEIPAPTAPLEADDILLHRSCLVSRQLGALDEVDAILATICRSLPQRMAYDGEESPCCGGRCHYRVLEPAGSHEAARRVVESLRRNDGARRMVTTSSMCRQAMDEAGDADAVHSLLELVCMAYEVL